MAEYKERDAFPEVPDAKVTIGDYGGDSRLAVNDIYSPKEEPILRDNIMDPVKPKEVNDYNSRIFSQQPEIILSGDTIKNEGQLINMINKFFEKNKVDNPFAVATATAKRMGHSDFSEGSEGAEKRGEIAEALKKGHVEVEVLDSLIDLMSKGTTESEALSLIENFLGA